MLLHPVDGDRPEGVESDDELDSRGFDPAFVQLLQHPWGEVQPRGWSGGRSRSPGEHRLIALLVVESFVDVGRQRRYTGCRQPVGQVTFVQGSDQAESVAELFADLAAKGFTVTPGDLGENITTSGVDLLALPTDTELRLGAQAVVRLTGLRNPCAQIDRFRHGLMQAVLAREADGRLRRLAGVMGVVVTGGDVMAGDAVSVQLPPGPPRALEPV